MTKRIENTAKTGVHPEWVMGGNPGAIADQESKGQHELTNSHQLPVDIRGDKASLEASGVKFGPPLKSDPLFCNSTLPSGWSKRKTAHSMHSELLDETGRVRATIFYKASFYDRCAFLSVSDE